MLKNLLLLPLLLLFAVSCTSKQTSGLAAQPNQERAVSSIIGQTGTFDDDDGGESFTFEAADFASDESMLTKISNEQASISSSLANAAEGDGSDSYEDMGNLLVLAAGGCADKVKAVVNKSKQRLSIFLNCSSVPTHVWKTSTGKKGHGTPNFNTRPSGRFGGIGNSSRKYPGGGCKPYGNMPYAVYFAANGNYAIHGTCAEGKLGGVASHGCIRISRANAQIFQGIVKKAGIGNTRIIVN